MKNLITLILILITATISGQVGISTDNPDSSAELDVSSTKKGVLIPRMTQPQRLAIDNPATGLLVFQIDLKKGFYYYDGQSWLHLSDTNQEKKMKTIIYLNN